jgi:hypothetical protein
VKSIAMPAMRMSRPIRPDRLEPVSSSPLEVLAWTPTRMATMRKCGIGSSHHCTNALPLEECSG